MLAFSGLREGQRVTVRARAKVNLGLEVLGRRADGYHELRSLLWAIDLADQVTLEATAEGIVVQCGAPGSPRCG
jgi:4-diphosphocytidyl-2-C-methyl-D-erythritol kinase